jgi:hypothetical protein
MHPTRIFKKPEDKKQDSPKLPLTYEGFKRFCWDENSGTAQVANQMAERGINIVSEESTTLRIANRAYFNQSYIIDPQIKQSRRERRAEQRRLKSCIKDN